ncbi:MAG: sodium/proton-translocating pyrophosphatase, partial [Schleiferiaceae bacterium]
MENLLYVVPILGLVGLAYMFVLRSWVIKQDTGTEKMSKLASYVKEGAMAFLNAEYRILAVFVVIAGILLGIISSVVETTHWFIVVAFVIGAVF